MNWENNRIDEVTMKLLINVFVKQTETYYNNRLQSLCIAVSWKCFISKVKNVAFCTFYLSYHLPFAMHMIFSRLWISVGIRALSYKDICKLHLSTIHYCRNRINAFKFWSMLFSTSNNVNHLLCYDLYLWFHV